jgi:HPt (histidine-containing phosphotransfer) domain-containing protein
MAEMFGEYKSHLLERVLEIKNALQEGDANRLARLAHNLKGISLNFSANPLADIALHLEEICMRENLSLAPPLVSHLETEARRVDAFLASNGY